MKHGKKLLSVLVCVCLLLCSLIIPTHAAGSNVSMTLSKAHVDIGESVTATIYAKDLSANGFGFFLSFDTSVFECISVTGIGHEGGFGLYEQNKADSFVKAQVFDTVQGANDDGIFSFGLLSFTDVAFAGGKVATLVFRAKASGAASFSLEEDTVGQNTFKGVADTKSVSVSQVVHSHVFQSVITSPTCTDKGYTTHVCRCGESFIDSFVSAYDHSFTDGRCTRCGKVDPNYSMVHPTVSIESVDATGAETFAVRVCIENNPGIVSFKFLIDYDESALELLSVEGGDFSNVSYGKIDTDPFVINWVDTVNPDNDTDGVVSTLYFRVREGANVAFTELVIKYNEADIYNSKMDNVAFKVENGRVTLTDMLHGDVNGDGFVDNKDLGVLMRYLNLIPTEIDLEAADVNNDGKVNNKDYGLIQRYLNNWDVELV